MSLVRRGRQVATRDNHPQTSHFSASSSAVGAGEETGVGDGMVTWSEAGAYITTREGTEIRSVGAELWTGN